MGEKGEDGLLIASAGSGKKGELYMEQEMIDYDYEAITPKVVH